VLPSTMGYHYPHHHYSTTSITIIITVECICAGSKWVESCSVCLLLRAELFCGLFCGLFVVSVCGVLGLEVLC
jgi:hypothetical protein